MGLVVVGFALLDIAGWYLILTELVYTPTNMIEGLSFLGLTFVHPGTTEQMKLIEVTATMLTFGMGASTQALFARVGGGIYTKAADVGLTSWARWKPEFPRMTRAIPLPSPTMSVTT